MTRSPGRSPDQTGRRRWPDDAISRDVRGRRVPCFANTYCTNPEQSNPVFGDVPPHRYGTPRYRSAVGSTRAADPDAERSPRPRAARSATPIAVRTLRAVAADRPVPVTSISTPPIDTCARASDAHSATAHSAIATTGCLDVAV